MIKKLDGVKMSKKEEFVFKVHCHNCNTEKYCYEIGKLMLCFPCMEKIHKELTKNIKEYRFFNKNTEKKANLNDFLGVKWSDTTTIK